jgi:hypothetical protein
MGEPFVCAPLELANARAREYTVYHACAIYAVALGGNGPMSDDKLAKHVEVFRKREESRATLIELRRTRARSAQQLAALAAELEELGKLESRERSRLTELTQETVKLLYADSAGLVADRLDDHNRLAGADVVAAVDGTNVHPITRP